MCGTATRDANVSSALPSFPPHPLPIPCRRRLDHLLVFSHGGGQIARLGDQFSRVSARAEGRALCPRLSWVYGSACRAMTGKHGAAVVDMIMQLTEPVDICKQLTLCYPDAWDLAQMAGLRDGDGWAAPAYAALPWASRARGAYATGGTGNYEGYAMRNAHGVKTDPFPAVLAGADVADTVSSRYPGCRRAAGASRAATAAAVLRAIHDLAHAPTPTNPFCLPFLHPRRRTSGATTPARVSSSPRSAAPLPMRPASSAARRARRRKLPQLLPPAVQQRPHRLLGHPQRRLQRRLQRRRLLLRHLPQLHLPKSHMRF